MLDADSSVPDGFRQIPGFPRYAVDENGTVLSVCGHVKERTKPWSEARRLTPTANRWGYLTVQLCHGGRIYLKRVHVLVLTTFVGPCPDGMQSRHLDGDKRNNRLSNLAWGTAFQNYQDMQLHGTNPHGERHGNAKLTEGAVRKIRERRGNGEILRVLAADFHVHFGTISKVARDESWKHVQGE